jgi:hypothetical protein
MNFQLNVRSVIVNGGKFLNLSKNMTLHDTLYLLKVLGIKHDLAWKLAFNHLFNNDKINTIPRRHEER